MRKSQIDALFSVTKQLILSTILLNPEKWWYLSDLAKNIGKTPSTLQRDLVALSKAEILEMKREGNRIYYKANDDCPFLADLQGLLIKTVGLKDILYDVIKKFKNKILISFIFGSVAKEEELSKSDIDLMIIGNIKLSELVKDLKKMEAKIGREINTTIYTEEEFVTNFNKKNNFILRVLEQEKIYLIGNDNELERFIK